jgi:hypothetical protein
MKIKVSVIEVHNNLTTLEALLPVSFLYSLTETDISHSLFFGFPIILID